jgi:hypothetical protein
MIFPLLHENIVDKFSQGRENLPSPITSQETPILVSPFATFSKLSPTRTLRYIPDLSAETRQLDSKTRRIREPSLSTLGPKTKSG